MRLDLVDEAAVRLEPSRRRHDVVEELVTLLPIYWMLVTSLKPANEIFSFDLIPRTVTFDNYTFAWRAIPFGAMLTNTVLNEVLQTFGHLFTGLLAAYAFARWRFRGDTALFMLFVGTWLVPFQVNPHYFSGPTFVKEGDTYREHFGETRDDRLRQFHEMNDAPVVGLWEGALVRVEGARITLVGGPARVFRKDREPVDVGPGQPLDGLLPERS